MQAANKLLKLIEEPPQETYFIFISNDQSKILPTINSRLQNISVPKMIDTEIAEALIKDRGVDSEIANNIAKAKASSFL